MTFTKIVPPSFLAFWLFVRAFTPAQAAFTDFASIQSFLHDNFSKTNSGMVIALRDEHGAKIFHAG